MLRLLAVFLVCGLIGAGSTRVLLGFLQEAEPTGTSITDLASVPEPDRSTAFQRADPPPVATIVGATMGAYQSAAQLDSEGQIQRRIGELVIGERSPERDAELEALLFRYLDLNPPGAVRYARDVGVPDEFVVSLFVAWSTVDFPSALGELAGVGNSRLRRDVAIAMVRELGSSETVIDQVLTVIDDVDRDVFESELLVRAARDAPASALQAALSLDDYWLSMQTAERIAAEWAWQDPLGALSYVQSMQGIEPRKRHSFHLDLWSEWSEIDPERALVYLASPQGRQMFTLRYGDVFSAVQDLGARRPDEFLELASTMPHRVALEMRLAAIPVIVDRDLDGAIAYAEQLPGGELKTQWIEAVAVAFARKDPAGALRWAQSQGHGSIVDRALTEIAATDLDLAVEFALAGAGSSNSIAQWLSPRTLASVEVREMEGIADRLVAAGPSRNEAVARMIESWVEIDPESALAWVLSNRSQLDAELVARVEDEIDRSAGR